MSPGNLEHTLSATIKSHTPLPRREPLIHHYTFLMDASSCSSLRSPAPASHSASTPTSAYLTSYHSYSSAHPLPPPLIFGMSPTPVLLASHYASFTNGPPTSLLSFISHNLADYAQVTSPTTQTFSTLAPPPPQHPHSNAIPRHNKHAPHSHCPKAAPPH